MRRASVHVALAGLLLVGCATDAGVTVSDDAAPAAAPGDPDRTPPADVMVRSPEPQPDGTVRTWPSSPPAEQAVEYPLTVHVHCGIDHALDFDGSFWDLVGPLDTTYENGAYQDVGRGGDDPWHDEGMITLVDENVAVYQAELGGTFLLERHDGPRDIPPCE